jgi:hypothetical protein
MKTSEARQIMTQHLEHRLWRNELSFYADEIKIYEHQLEELVSKGIKEMLPQLEQFQNSFIRQKEVLDEINHEINIHEQALAGAMANDSDGSASDLYDHEGTQDKYDMFKKIYGELKTDFFQFLKKWH